MKQTILFKILANSKKKKAIISARKYNDDDTLYVGYIVDFNDSLFLMQQISTYGLHDGLLIESLDNIESFEINEYEKSYQYLFENTDKISEQTISSLTLPKGAKWKYNLLKTLFAQKKIVTIQLSTDNTIVTGFITDLDEKYLHFNMISNIGEDQGKIIYKLTDISTFTIDELESRKRNTFYKWRQKA